jgi:hypothetical protein
LDVSLSNLESSATCQYKNRYYDFHENEECDFTCHEPTEDTDSKFCIFHDTNYLKDENYEKHKKEVSKKFAEKLSEYRSKNEPLKFIGYCLPDISFGKKKFSEAVYFQDASFYGATDFSDAKFYREAYFYRAIFSKEANFSGATFSGKAYFNGAPFFELASFSGATFSELVNFTTIFYKEADFVDTKFSKEASFSGATFSELANFEVATFSGYAAFAATFTGEANFESATFSNKASFGQSTFSNKANFRAATFNDEADFGGFTISQNGATFTGEANFEQATFSKVANFSGGMFIGEASFSGATFTGEANFIIVTFFNKASFSGATFSNEARFGKVKFLLGANFFVSTFLSKAYFSGEFNDSTDFTNATFEKPSKVTFDIGNMAYVSFSDTDTTRIKFSDKVTWGGDDKFTIIDEKWLIEDIGRRKKGKLENKPIEKRSDEGQSVSLELVSSVYRNLRENYEFRLRYGDAGRFFIKEMDLKRKYREASSLSTVKLNLIKLLRKLKLRDIPEPKVDYEVQENGWWRRNLFSLTGWYYHLSRYGEDLLRPTLVGLVIVTLSTLFWLMQSKPTLEPHFFVNSSLYNSASHFVYLNQAGNLTQWQKAFERSLSDLIPLLPSGSKVEIGLLDYIIKIAGGALTFGLLAIALRRKFERKYTR